MYLFWQVGADDKLVLDKIVDSLTSLANPNESKEFKGRKKNTISLKVGRFKDTVEMEADTEKKASVLILGAGRVCRPAAEFLTSIGSDSPQEWLKSFRIGDLEEQTCVQVIVASLFLKDAEEVRLKYIFLGTVLNVSRLFKNSEEEREKKKDFLYPLITVSSALIE